MNIYITRHGETEWNTQDRMQGWKNSNLTELGKKQAAGLRDRLKDIKIDVIYSSTLKRAHDTAKILKGNKNVDIILSDNLKEMSFGKWEGMTFNDIKSNLEYKDEYYNLYNMPEKYKTFGGENIDKVSNRISTLLDKIINEKKYDDILIVTHGMTLKYIMKYFAPKIGVECENIIFGQTSLTHIKFENAQFELVTKNDTLHY